MKKLFKWGLIIFVGVPFAFLLVLGVIGNLISGKPEEPSTTTTQAPTKQEEVAASPTAKPAAQFFDVPSLVGKNADEVATLLKSFQRQTTPPSQEQIKLGVKDWDMEFEKDGKDLLVSYVIATKRINDFFISTDDPNGSTKDKKHLLELGNLSENDSRYKVEFVKTLKDSSRFTGVKVTPR